MKWYAYVIIALIAAGCDRSTSTTSTTTPDRTDIDTSYYVRQDWHYVLEKQGKCYTWEIRQGRRYIKTVFLFESAKYSNAFDFGPDMLFVPKVTKTMLDRRYGYCEKIITDHRKKKL